MGRKREIEPALVVAGGVKPRKRKAQPRDWTVEKERTFMAVLADTCNVTRAAEEAGVTTAGAYKRRKQNAAFRAGWLEAIGVAYQQLELVLLDRAFNGTEKVVTRKDGSEERMREYSNQLGMALLKIHRDTAIEAQTELSAEEVDEIRERLIQKFQRLKKRVEREPAKA